MRYAEDVEVEDLAKCHDVALALSKSLKFFGTRQRRRCKHFIFIDKVQSDCFQTAGRISGEQYGGCPTGRRQKIIWGCACEGLWQLIPIRVQGNDVMKGQLGILPVWKYIDYNSKRNAL